MKGLDQPVKLFANRVKGLGQPVNLFSNRVKALGQTVKLFVNRVKALDQTVKLFVNRVKALDQTVNLFANRVKALDQTVKLFVNRVKALEHRPACGAERSLLSLPPPKNQLPPVSSPSAVNWPSGMRVVTGFSPQRPDNGLKPGTTLLYRTGPKLWR